MPFALTYLRSAWWFLFFGLMWTVALCGFVSKTLFSHRVDAVAIWSLYSAGVDADCLWSLRSLK